MEDVAVDLVAEDLPGHFLGPMSRLVEERTIQGSAPLLEMTWITGHCGTRSTQLLSKTTCALHLPRSWSQTGISRLNASVQSASVQSPRLPHKSRDAHGY